MKSATTGLVVIVLLLMTAPLSAQTGWNVQTKGDIQTFNANDNGNKLFLGWANGNAGNTWDEGEWLPVQIKLTNVNFSGTFTDIVIAYDFTKGGARFMDLVRHLQVGTTPLTNDEGWPDANGNGYSMTTRAELEIAQKSEGVYQTPLEEPVWNKQVNNVNTWWPIDTTDRWMRVNRDLNFNLGSPTDAEHVIRITKADLLNTIPAASQGAGTFYIYFALHLSQSFIWQNSLQQGLATGFAGLWGGYLYDNPTYAADSRNGSSAVSGSSGQLRIVTATGNKTSQLPIPPAPIGTISGSKYFDLMGDGSRGTGDFPLPKWTIYASTNIGGIAISLDTLTDASGNWSFTSLPAADYFIYEIEEGPGAAAGSPYNASPILAAVSQTQPWWGQSYPQSAMSTPIPVPLSPNPYHIAAPSGYGYAPIGYLVHLDATRDTISQIDFNNTIPAPICEINGLDARLCYGATATFLVRRIAYGTPPYTYSWTGPNNFTSTSQTVSVVADINTAGMYTATITDANGKSSTCTAMLVLFPRPDCTIGGPTTLCEGGTGTFTGPNPTGGSAPIIAYSWSILSGNATLRTPTNLQSVTLDVGTYDPNNPTFTLQLSVTSDSGCVEVCQYVVNVETIISCPAPLTLQCNSSVPQPDPTTVTVNQNCNLGTVNVTHESDVVSNPTGPNCYTLTRTYKAVVVSSNFTTYCTQVITVNDDTKPLISPAAANKTVECDGAGNTQDLANWLADNGGARATDNCTATANLVWTYAPNPAVLSDLCGQTGAVTVTFRVTDECGNYEETTATFTIVDTTPPTVTPAIGETSECQGTNPNANTDYLAWLAKNGNATATDVCSTPITWSNNAATQTWSGTCIQTISVTFTATDDCNNASSTTATFTIEDTTPPTIDSAAVDESIECDGSGITSQIQDWLADNGHADASDICNPFAWSNNFDANNFVQQCGGTGYIDVTFTATDNCNNAASTTARFTIIDTTPPTIDSAAVDETIECDGNGIASQIQAWLADNGHADASDICSPFTWSNNFDASNFVPLCGGTGYIDVTFKATDACNNFSTTTARFEIIDTTPPTIDTAAVDETIECDGTGITSQIQAWLADNGHADASDICSPFTWSNNFDANNFIPTCGGAGYIDVTFTATDDCQNASSTTARFEIIDTTPPTIDTLAVDETIECDGTGITSQIQAWLADNGHADASDICSPFTWSNNFNANNFVPTCGGAGYIDVTFTATDQCQNSSSTTARFEIIDTTPPTIDTLAVDETIECDGTGITSQIQAWLADNGHADASDICSPFTWSNNFNASNFVPTCGGAGYIDVTFTATDQCQNAASTTARFEIIDTTPPDITTPASGETAECEGTDPNQNSVYMAWLAKNGNAIASDLCGSGVNWTNNAATQSWSGTCTKTITVTFTATDNCQNSASTSATFTITDTTPPSITTQASNGSAECQGVNPSLNTLYLAWLANNGGAAAADLCGNGVAWTNNSATQSWTGTCTKTITVTFTATDNCQNSASTTATFTVTDTQAPYWITSPPTNVIVDCGTDPIPFWDPKYGTDYSDNCDPAPMLIIVISDQITPQPDGTKWHYRVWQLKDACNNLSATISQTIVERPCQFLTYTQGFYGNLGGQDCANGYSTLHLLNSTMLLQPLVVGDPSYRSFTIPADFGKCLIYRMPSGGTAAALPIVFQAVHWTFADTSSCNIVGNSAGLFPQLSNGKFSNILLGQTITFALNLRLDPNLTTDLFLPAPSTPYLWTVKSDYVNGVCMDGNDVDTGSATGYYIPTAVLTALGSNGSNRSLTDLLDLANDALAGNVTSGPTLTEITMALDAYNKGFDAARFFNGYHAAAPPKAVVRQTMPEDFKLHQNHPNPFNPTTTITFTIPEECTVRLAVYNSLGDEVEVLIDRVVPAGTHPVIWNSDRARHSLPSGIYTYRIHATGSDGKEFHDIKKMVLVK